MRRITGLLVVSLSSAIAATAGYEIRSADSSVEAENHVIVGMLEELPGRYAKEPNFRAVRVLFEKRGDDWQSFRSDCRDMACLKSLPSEYPTEVTWTIAFDGKNLGQITTRRPSEFKLYADMGLEEITSAEPVPTVGKRSLKNAGFGSGEVYRPLVAVSQPNFRDPETWKPAQLSEEIIASLRKEFRKKFQSVENCTSPEENTAKPWLYRDEDIVPGKAYGSTKKWFVAEMSLTGWHCDGPVEDGSPFVPQWYVVEPGGTVRFLDSGMWLVDAGDYDNDGKSELVFAVSGYDWDGYELFYDDLRKSAIFKFIYH